MKIVIFGGTGKIGSAIAFDLIKQEGVTKVGIVGSTKVSFELRKGFLQNPKLEFHLLDVCQKEESVKLMQAYDIVVNALPNRRLSYKSIEAAIEAKRNVVDIIEEYHRRPEMYEREGLELPEGKSLEEYGEWLHTQAIKNNVTILDGMGFAPGLSNITAAQGIEMLDKPITVVARVGGIPSKESATNYPLQYMITWSFEHVLREYMVNLNTRKDGKVIEVEALSGYEQFNYRRGGVDEELECFVTPGMPSFLYTRPKLSYFEEKSIRWPGHHKAITDLKSYGILSNEVVVYNGDTIVPRDFFASVIIPKLKPKSEDSDVCVMYNTVMGLSNDELCKIEYFMWDKADVTNGISSMARVTGYSAAIGALFLGYGKIKPKGIIAPEDAVVGDLYNDYIAELKKRGIKISTSTHTG